MADGLIIDWCDEPGQVAELAAFFAANLTPEYISHSELMGPRARGPRQWSPDIVAVLEKDFRARCGADHGPPPPGEATKHAIAARKGGKLAGVAMLTFSAEAAAPFGIVEDIVVDNRARAQKLGSEMMSWIMAAFRAAGLKRAFLESGEGNHHAHRFFERWGFHTVSVVMMSELPPSGGEAR